MSLVCRWRSIPGCSGRAGRCAAFPARFSSKRSNRSRPDLTGRASLRVWRAFSRKQQRVWSPKAGIGNQGSGISYRFILMPDPRCLMPRSRQLVREQMQIALAVAERLERAHRFDDVIAVLPGTAVALPHIMQALLDREPAGILHMAAVDDVGERPHLAARLVLELDPPHRLEIDGGDLLAAAQIGDGAVTLRGGDTEGDAGAHAAAGETHNQAGFLWRAAVDVGKHAERPVQPNEPRRHPLPHVKTRPPHQRAIA